TLVVCACVVAGVCSACSVTKSRAGTCCERRPRRSCARGCRPKWPGPSKGANLGRLSSLSPPFLGCGRRSRPYLGFIETVSTVFRPHAPLEENRAADYRRSSVGNVHLGLTHYRSRRCYESQPDFQ